MDIWYIEDFFSLIELEIQRLFFNPKRSFGCVVFELATLKSLNKLIRIPAPFEENKASNFKNELNSILNDEASNKVHPLIKEIILGYFFFKDRKPY